MPFCTKHSDARMAQEYIPNCRPLHKIPPDEYLAELLFHHVMTQTLNAVHILMQRMPNVR